jgi:replicative DNA helicase
MENELLKSLQSLTVTENIQEDELIAQLKLIVHQAEANTQDDSLSIDLKSFIEPSFKKVLSPSFTFNSLETGFFNIDNTVGLLNPGEFTVLAGRPGMGTTTLMLNMAIKCANNSGVLYCFNDTAQHVFANRILSIITSTPRDKINRNLLSPDERKRVASYEKHISSLKLYLHDTNKLTISQLRYKCEKAVQEHSIKLVVIDPLQYLCKTKNRNHRELELSYICKELKRMARELSICVVAISQLSRNVEYRGGTKVPQLSDLRDSGAIEQDSDNVAFLYRPSYYNITEDEFGRPTANTAELHIAKNTNGPLTYITLKHDSAFTQFYESTEIITDFQINNERLGEIPPFF